jgi:hypothetical protein
VVQKLKRRGTRWSPSHLQKLIEETCLDACYESKQEGGFLVGLEEHFDRTYPPLVIGEEVTVLGFDIDKSWRGLVARIRRKGKRCQVDFTVLERPRRVLDP